MTDTSMSWDSDAEPVRMSWDPPDDAGRLAGCCQLVDDDDQDDDNYADDADGM